MVTFAVWGPSAFAQDEAELAALAAMATPEQPGTIVSARAFPVGDVVVSREDITSHSFVLHFENLDLAGKKTKGPNLQTYMLAGARGRIPSAHVKTAEFVHVSDNRITSTTTELPQQLRQSFIRANDLGQMRQFWTYTLSISMSTPAGTDGEWICKRASVLVDIGIPPVEMASPEAERFIPRDGKDALARAMLLNPDIAPEYYVIDYSDPLDSWKAWNSRLLAGSDGMFKLKIHHGGFYRLAAEDLIAATTGTISTPASQWRVYRNGTEVPLIPNIEQPDSAVYLPVAQKINDGLWTEVYWLDTGSTATDDQAAPLRYEIADTDAPAWNTSVTAPQSTATFSIIHRELVDYNPRLRINSRNDKWVWADLSAGAPARLNLNMPGHFDPPATATVTARVKYGFSNFPPIVPTLVLNLSNHYAAQTTLTTQMGEVQLELPATALRPGRNEIALQLQYPPEATSKRPVSIQLIETKWVQNLKVPQRESYFFQTETGTTAPLQFAAPLTPEYSVFSFGGQTPQRQDSTGRRVQTGSPGSTMLLANINGAEPVTNIERTTGGLDLTEMESARAIIIAAPEVLQTAYELADMQRERDLNVQVFNVNSLSNIFAFGDQNPAAIQNALRYLYSKAPGNPPEFITLIGEASEFRGDPAIAPELAQLEMLPASTADKPEAIQGDEKYAASIGNDLVADFIIGRIPASEPSHVRNYMTKIRRYMAEEPGEWSRRTQFVMDDNDEFPDVVNQVVGKTLSPLADNNLFRQWDYEYVPNMRVQGKKRSWQATGALIDTFNQGLGIVNFFGHGGPNLWSHERLFHLSDLPQVNNPSQLPLITCASCDNAWISYPMAPVNESMGELLVLKPDGGAIGLFGPVSGASPYEHSTLVQNLMEAILREQIRYTGEAIFYAKNMYYATTRSSSIPEQYLLLGDPTIQLKMPVVEPLLSGPPEDVQINAEGPTQISVSVTGGLTLLSPGTLTITASGSDRVLGEQAVRQRQSRWVFNLPSDYDGGCVMALLEWEEDGKTRLAGTSMRVIPAEEGGSAGRVTRESILGGTFDIKPASSNAAASDNLRSINLELKPTLEDFTTGTVQVESFVAGKPLGAPQAVNIQTTGTYTGFTISANQEVGLTSGPITVVAMSPPAPTTIATFTVAPPPMADVEFVPGSAKVYAMGGQLFSGATAILEAQIRNVGTAPASRIAIHGMKDSPTTGTELVTINDSTSIRVENLQPGETRTVKFRWEGSLTGKYPNVYLVANRNKLTPETNLSNNSIAMPEFEVVRVGNFTVKDFDVSPRFVTQGTPVVVSAVLENDNMPVDLPVTVELGWVRAFDGSTTYTRFPVNFKDGVSTITRETIAPEAYNHIYLTVNADREIEESNLGDNTVQTPSMMSYDLPDFQRAISLGDSLLWGVSHNVIMPFEAQLQVTGDFTSKTEYILSEVKDVVSGEAVPADNPNDNKWQVARWRIAAGKDENPGELQIAPPVHGTDRDVPGRVIGLFAPYGSGGVPVEIKTNGNWFTPPERGTYTRLNRLDFGVTSMVDGRLPFGIRKVANSDVSLNYIDFFPHAMQWDSVPYMLPARIQSKELIFAMDTNQNQWQTVYVEYRSGNWANDIIEWAPWQSTKDSWSIPFKAGEFVQFRVIAVPKPGMQPFIENFRISK